LLATKKESTHEVAPISITASVLVTWGVKQITDGNSRFSMPVQKQDENCTLTFRIKRSFALDLKIEHLAKNFNTGVRRKQQITQLCKQSQNTKAV
jgi:hypothetical protein